MQINPTAGLTITIAVRQARLPKNGIDRHPEGGAEADQIQLLFDYQDKIDREVSHQKEYRDDLGDGVEIAHQQNEQHQPAGEQNGIARLRAVELSEELREEHDLVLSQRLQCAGRGHKGAQRRREAGGEDPDQHCRPPESPIDRDGQVADQLFRGGDQGVPDGQ